MSSLYLSAEVEPQSSRETIERQLWSKCRLNVQNPSELPFFLYHLLSGFFYYTVTLRWSQSMYFTLPDPLVKSFSRLFAFRKLLLTAHPLFFASSYRTLVYVSTQVRTCSHCMRLHTYVMLTISLPEITGSKARIDIFPRCCLNLQNPRSHTTHRE